MLVECVDNAQRQKLLGTEKRSEETAARTALARELHGIEETGGSSIKKRSAGASQLGEDDAFLVSVV